MDANDKRKEITAEVLGSLFKKGTIKSDINIWKNVLNVHEAKLIEALNKAIEFCEWLN